MNYRIKEISGNGVVLSRSDTLKYILVPLFILISIFFFFISTGAFAEAADVKPGFLYSGMGTIFFCGALLLAFNVKMPYEIIFSNGKGCVIINEKIKGKFFSASIPYEDILDFSMAEHRSENSSGYTVDMEKKDGAIWTLLSASLRKNAEKFLETLKQNINLNNPSSGSRASGDTNGFKISEEKDLS